MVEQKRTQLFMMLVQQSGVGSLPLSYLGRREVLAFMRNIEQAATKERSPVIVYWSTRNSGWLRPDSTTHRQLVRDAYCIAEFFEEHDHKQEEFLFIVESQGVCTVVYGSHGEEDGQDTFQCVGSVDPDIVRRAVQMMLSWWQFLDLGETNRLEDARNKANMPDISPKLVQEIRTAWPVVRPPAPTTAYGDANSETAAPQGAPIKLTPPYAGNVVELRGMPSHPANIECEGEDTTWVSARGNAVIGASPPLNRLEDNVSFKIATANGTNNTLRTSKAPREKRDAKTMKGLREVWTTISEESRTVYPPDAQRIIRDIMGQIRLSRDHSSILQMAIEELTKVVNADRGLIWQVMDDQLTVTNEFAVDGEAKFVDTDGIPTKLPKDESAAIVGEFRTRFPDVDSGTGVIAISDTQLDTKVHKVAQTLNSYIELGGTRARLVAQMLCGGQIHGYLELQQFTTREWSEQDGALLQSVSETLSVVVQQAIDLHKREMDAQQMKLINSISEMFRESKGQRSKDTLSKSVKLVAEHLGFINSQVYLLIVEDMVLWPQIVKSPHNSIVHLSEKKNPFVQVCEGRGKVRMFNFEATLHGDPFFEHDAALVVPLESEGETLGVVGFWGRKANGRPLRPGEDPELAQTICNNLANIVRVEKSDAKDRQDRAREQLINKVTQVIRNSPKDVDSILDELVTSLREYLSLGLCAVSLFDAPSQEFVKSKVAGDMEMPEGKTAQELTQSLFKCVLPQLSAALGAKDALMLEPKDVQELAQQGLELPKDAHLVVIVPVIHQESLKAALCLASSEKRNLFLKTDDMKMIETLADRVAVDISHKDLFEQVERQAVTDPMTGLHNRRHFSEQLSKEIDRNQRFGHPFSYIILDLDFLKKINDRFGHQLGDAAIKHIANTIKKCVRDVDTTARFGGEEFVVLLPETDIQGARVVAERMCHAIADVPVEGIGQVTASLGLATFPYDAQDRDKLTELADQALYLAKHRGRNRVCSVSEELMPSLSKRGEEALEVQKATIKARADELATIDLNLLAEHGLGGILAAVMKMIEAKDAYAQDRSPRATDYATKLSQALHLSKEHSAVISLAAILHNIGKVAISEEILQKKEALTSDEWEVVRTSPAMGAKILEPAKHLYRVAAVVECYHEHWDGTGYPKGLKGEQIPLESRIIALIDAYVAMTSDRPYRKAMSPQAAAAVLQQGGGKEWDPRLVRLFLSILSKDGNQPA